MVWVCHRDRSGFRARGRLGVSCLRPPQAGTGPRIGLVRFQVEACPKLVNRSWIRESCKISLKQCYTSRTIAQPPPHKPLACFSQ